MSSSKNFVIALDGGSGTGKSTTAKIVAKTLGITYLDTGAMYRSVALTCLERGIDPNDAEAATKVAQEIEITFGQGPAGQTVQVDGHDVTSAIRTPEVDKAVSPVAAVPAVREAMVAQQRALGAVGDVVAEGRDIGTVVFPDAEVKVFLTADPAARALRRAVQRDGGDAAKDANATADEAAVAEILADIKRRDAYDSSREASPLKPAADAHHIDSSLLSVDEVVAQIADLMEAARS